MYLPSVASGAVILGLAILFILWGDR